MSSYVVVVVRWAMNECGCVVGAERESGARYKLIDRSRRKKVNKAGTRQFRSGTRQLQVSFLPSNSTSMMCLRIASFECCGCTQTGPRSRVAWA